MSPVPPGPPRPSAGGPEAPEPPAPLDFLGFLSSPRIRTFECSFQPSSLRYRASLCTLGIFAAQSSTHAVLRASMSHNRTPMRATSHPPRTIGHPCRAVSHPRRAIEHPRRAIEHPCRTRDVPAHRPCARYRASTNTKCAPNGQWGRRTRQSP